MEKKLHEGGVIKRKKHNSNSSAIPSCNNDDDDGQGTGVGFYFPSYKFKSKSEHCLQFPPISTLPHLVSSKQVPLTSCGSKLNVALLSCFLFRIYLKKGGFHSILSHCHLLSSRLVGLFLFLITIFLISARGDGRLFPSSNCQKTEITFDNKLLFQ